MQNSKELYKTLSADFKAEKNFCFADRGEGMMQGREKDTDRIFLVNNNTKEAWALIAANSRFSFWDASAVEIVAAFALPYKAYRNAIELRAPYHFLHRKAIGKDLNFTLYLQTNNSSILCTQ